MAINRQHKDRLFKLLFGNETRKEWTLSLYNAVNGTSYENESDIILTTIEDAVYMGMKNDVSFIMGDMMNMYEQSSTVCPNMPMRFLVYTGMLYAKYVQDGRNNINLYSSRQQKFPVPKLVCFYNGRAEEPDRRILELRDAFDGEADADISVKVTMLNINSGRNKELMEACQALREYAWLIRRIRDNQTDGNGIEDAVDKTLESMPEDFLIKPLLEANRAEVKQMCITEYDEARTMEMFREEGKAEGLAEGRAEGRAEERKNTERERRRADKAEEEVRRLRMELEALKAGK